MRVPRLLKAVFSPAVLIVFLSGPVIYAQFPMAEGPAGERSRPESEADLEARIARMRYLISLAEKRTTRRKTDPKLALEQLQDDFTNLQILNKDLVLTTSKSDELDLKFVERSAREINRRAERLMENLALPESEPGTSRQKLEAPRTRAQLKEAITKLGWLIYWFVKNPIFKEAQVIEAASATKARRDLEDILLRSSHLKMASEELRHARGKSQ